MAKGKDERHNTNRSVTRTRSYGYVGTPSTGLPSGSDMKDDPQLKPINVGSTKATPQKGYFPVIESPQVGETVVSTADRKKTRWGAKRQAKKYVKNGIYD